MTAPIEPTVLDARRLVLCAESDRVRWLLFKWGEVLHHVDDFTVDEEFAAAMLSSFESMTADGYHPPVLEEHTANGCALGLVLALSTDDEGVWADVELADGVREEVDSGKRPYLSPSFFPRFVHPHTGEELKTVLREVSLVSVPHLKNLRPLGSHYSLSESGWATTTQEAALADTESTETPETAPVENEEGLDLGAMIEALGEAVSNLTERVSLLEGAGDEPEPEEEPEEPPAPMDNSERIAELERQLALANARNDVMAVLPTANAEEVDDLAHAIVADKARGTRLLSMAERAQKPGKATVQEAIGRSGVADVHTPMDFSEAWDTVKTEDGLVDSSEIMNALVKRYPSLAGTSLI